MRRRPAVPADLAWAVEVARDGIAPWVPPGFVWERFEQGIAERLVGAEVLERGGVPIGWMRVMREPERVVLDQVFLASGARGRGLGTALVREVMAPGLPVELRVLKGNAAHRLYARLGFRVFREGGTQWHLRWEPGWAGPLAVTDWAGPTRAAVGAVLARVGLAGPAVRVASTGLANHVFAAGDAVLRIATATEDGLSDARTEAAAVPAAIAAGVRTPALLAFDETGRDVPVPFTVYARVEGEVGAESAAVWREVGRELARVHAIGWVPDGAGWLDDHAEPDARGLLGHAAALDPGLPERLDRWLDGAPTGAGAPRFLHGDAHARNVLARDGRLAALIDWGDAGWGDPALDFEPMPLRFLRSALEGYREAGGTDDGTLEGRAVRAALAVALLRIARPKPRRRPTARLEEWVAAWGT